MLALLVAGLGIPLAASTFLPVRGVHDWLVPGALWRLPGSVHLTFDDGPDAERTPRVLDLLATFGVRATFFLVGERVARATPLVRRIASEGHFIGNHGWDHATLSFASRRKICEQLSRSQDAIGSVLGKRPTLFRPPFGRRDYRLYQETRRLGLTTVFWSLDSGDWLGVSPARIARRVSRAAPGDIVLLHDGNPRASGTIAALSTILSRHQPSLQARRSEGALA
jgi:peptidoglycan/xylan/chitin deacetylase (PgdA/CDA1 family)